ncbi:MAG: hypothetical protein SP1CHLAM54_07350 [Chlamydiia bacterium]|nr:hypothetical protein [Chlamydiia bacterium]MCH9615641.1 hypothetical protein [Chlamydiia bacterium]MCH9628956.1 hypothetical protein [Chlamydiia bacterium]
MYSVCFKGVDTKQTSVNKKTQGKHWDKTCQSLKVSRYDHGKKPLSNN